MAEGLFRHFAGDSFEVLSAGIKPTQVNPLAVKVMGEIGIDISGQRSKSVTGFLNDKFDYVITVCDSARRTCPVFPGEYERLHWNLEDPAEAQGTEEERLIVFRRVRNKIKERVISFLGIAKDTARLKCPHCGRIQDITVPGNMCLHAYKCNICGEVFEELPGTCCVICAFSDKTCPVFR
jgi:arsenate reductase